MRRRLGLGQGTEKVPIKKGLIQWSLYKPFSLQYWRTYLLSYPNRRFSEGLFDFFEAFSSPDFLRRLFQCPRVRV